jgi:predicted nicotinamide N-methyase
MSKIVPDSTPYQTMTETHSIGGKDYQIQSLKDRRQYYDPQNEAGKANISSASWPIFGQVWPAGLILADIMCKQDIQGLRILELGCGLGIASMIATERGAHITATDHHPTAQTFMAHNSRINKIHATQFALCDWTNIETDFGLFDLIIGSDLLYEAEHPKLLCEFIHRHCEASSNIIMVDGGRKLGGKFNRRMEEKGFDSNTDIPDKIFYASLGFKGKVMRYNRDVITETDMSTRTIHY